METLQTIFEHRTVRKFRSDEVPSDLLEKILAAGTRAATTGNMQVYSIIVTTDPEERKAISPFHFNQPMVTQAPVVLTFCADFNRFNRWCEINNADPGYENFISFFTAAIDALLAAQNVCLAAEDMGLGTVYLGTTTYNADKLIEYFKLPRGVVPVTTLVIGYPQEMPGLTDRLPVEAVVHYRKYKDYSDEKIRELFREKEAMPFYQDIVKENGVENLAQVFTQKRYTLKDNLYFSKALLDVLQKQGFMNQE